MKVAGKTAVVEAVRRDTEHPRVARHRGIGEAAIEGSAELGRKREGLRAAGDGDEHLWAREPPVLFDKVTEESLGRRIGGPKSSRSRAVPCCDPPPVACTTDPRKRPAP